MGSCLPWGSLSLVLFLLLQYMLHLSSGCFVEERAALLDIRSSLIRAHCPYALDPWGEDGDDYCSWDLVECNNRTQRVSHLYLSSVYLKTYVDDCWYLNSSVFSAFRELQHLDLSLNSFCSVSLEGLVGLSMLRYFDISGSLLLGGGFPEFIGQVVSLEVLTLNDNEMNGSLPAAAVENLRNLRQLNMSRNSFSGNLPDSLFALPHLKILDLSGNEFGGGIPGSSFSGPNSLEVLDLSGNNLNGTLRIRAFRNITSLNLGENRFSGSLHASLFSLPRLKFLGLSGNNFEGRFPSTLSSDPVPLQVLHLEYNKLSGALPTEQAFVSLQNLRELYLSSNQFSGNFPTFLFLLPHIEQLNLSSNLFKGPILMNPPSNLSLSLKSLRFSGNNLSGRFSVIWLGNFTKLEEIDLSGNVNLVVHVNIPGWTPMFQLKQLLLSGCDLDNNIIAEPHFLSSQRHLEVLDLSNNNLSGNMPNWLFTKEATLQDLNLGNNSLTGSLDPIWHTQSSLSSIKIHMNHLTGQLPANLSSMFPYLGALDVSNNDLFGYIPKSMCEINSMEFLDLSNNNLSGEVPACVFTNMDLILKVSNNKLGGPIFGGMNNLSSIHELYLDGNKFKGTLPHDLAAEFLRIIDLHDNELSGELDTSFWNTPYLKALNLAGNHITGKIDQHICGFTEIRLVDLSRNNLTGSVPNSCFMMLNFLNLTGNSLSGKISFPLFNTSSLIALDIRHNQFMGNLSWVGYLKNIRLLSLGGNKFEGQITPNLCRLVYLRIIDLSHNKLSGSLPACIGNISFKGDTDDEIFQPIDWIATSTYNSSFDLRDFTFATKGNLYTYGHNFFVSMSGIDLSANMLDGEIPWELGNLSHIKSLNLSYNLFVGSIPTTIGGMKEIESLDLSHNKLSGPVPLQLAQLSSLGAFSVAYNNLSGCIPNSGQLGSFSMDSYLPNTNLHKIIEGNTCAAPGPDLSSVKDDRETHSAPVLYVVTAAGFVLAFWATIGFSFFHPYGRSVMLNL
ncbi:receptor-like protein 13 [Hordeum vulgare subsp. vulgare]|uniref:Leucine-rich repeat-containing N-terminal plant-type domain-containing protein n=1 Tax=Hordeum vulgare subsp. vulgare TaxID=112509 RepID=A0A8I6X822_HORVV|nr:receptor-like protein 13 [Hordeum vulgare subsp. vulgare]